MLISDGTHYLRAQGFGEETKEPSLPTDPTIIQIVNASFS